MSEDNQYQGSQAFNQSENASEAVTRNTGSLTLSKVLVDLRGLREGIGLELTLSYSAGGTGLLGCPPGWGFGIAYVVPGASLTAQGKTNVIDPTWSDSTGYQSGLRYVNDHGVLFQTIAPPQPLPSGQPGSYSFMLRNNDGSVDYFDQAGKLLEHDDLFGNYIYYTYNDQFGTPFTTTLASIIDSFGQTVTFGNGPSSIVITTPDGSETTINYAGSGVQNVVDPLGNVTSFTYTTVAGQTVISEIQYPTGLQTNVGYTTISYNTASGAGAFPAVQDHIHLGAAGELLDHTQYAYGAATAGCTFTGAAAGYVLSGSGDSLMDSNNTSYLYDVLVSRLGADGQLLAASQVFYNFLHLPMREEHLLVVGGVAANGFLAVYTYVLDPLLPARAVTYAMPTVTDQSIYSAAAQDYIPLRRATASYDDFGQLLTSEEFLYDRTTQAFVSQVAVTHTYVEASWGGEMPATELTTDSVTGFRRLVTYALTANQKSVASSAVTFCAGGQAEWSAWKTKTFSYDSSGRIVATTLTWSEGSSPPPDSVPSTSLSHSYSYDAPSNIYVIATTNALGNTITRSYDVSRPRGVMTKVVSPIGERATYAYDALGRTVRETDPAGNVTTTTYTTVSVGGSNTTVATGPTGYVVATTFDGMGRRTTVMDNGDPTVAPSATPTRLLRRLSYDLLGRVASATNEIGLTVTSQYDSLGRLVSTTDPLGNVSTTVFDDAAMTKTSAINGDLRTIEQMDGLGRPVALSLYADSGDPNITTYQLRQTAYDGTGHILTTSTGTVPLGGGSSQILYQSSFTYDVESKVATETYVGTNGAKATLTRTSRRDIFGNAVITSKQVLYADGRSFTVPGPTPAFDAAGRLASITNRLGQVESYAYDADDRLITRTRFDGTIFSYAYDPNGQLLTMTGGGLEVTHSYFANGRIRNTSSGASTMAFTYGIDGGALSVTFPDGRAQTYQLDSSSRVVGETDAAGASTAIAFDALGRVASRQHGGDTITYDYGTVNHSFGVLTGDALAGTGSLTRTLAYDGLGQVSGTTTRNGAGSLVLEAGLVRDAAGRLTGLTLSSQTSTDAGVNLTRQSTYDGLDQLVGTVTSYAGGGTQRTSTFEYDGNFNIVTRTDDTDTRTLAYNAADQLVGPGLVYDANGRMTADGTGRTYAYNALDQLVGVADAQANVLAQYTYHPDGSLASTTTPGDSLGFYYNGGRANVVATTESGGSATMTTFLLDAAARRSAYEGGGAAAYYVTGAGSTAILQQGETATALEYDSYGAVLNGAALAGNVSFGWNQEHRDPTSGLVYLRSRYYNPSLMRFMTMDNLTMENRYAYCDGDPLNRFDPGGHASTGEILGMVFGAVVGIAVTVITGGVAGAGAAAIFGTECVTASIGAATLAGAAGSIAGDGTDAAIAGQPFTAKRALVDLASGAAGGAVGGGVGGYVGRAAMASALAEGLSQRAITNIGMVCSGFAGGLAGGAAASAVTAGAYGQPFFSSSTALNMATGAAAGIGGGFLTSGAYLGKLNAKIIPVPLTDSPADLAAIRPAVPPPGFVSPTRLVVMAPQPEALESMAGFEDLGGAETALTLDYNPGSSKYDTIAAHGGGNTMLVSVEYQQAPAEAGQPNYVRPMRGDRFATYLRDIGFDQVGERRAIKLMSCYAGFSNAQTIADALQRPVYAGYSGIDRFSFRKWTWFQPK